MPFIRPLYGQSNYDLCLQGYGSIDNVVRLCKDNGISDLNLPQSKQYVFNQNLIINRINCGYQYVSSVQSESFFAVFATEYSTDDNVYAFCMEDDTDKIFVKE
jgi:hypothetical protein